MRLRLNLYGALRRYAPAGESPRGWEREVGTESTPRSVLAQIGVPASAPVNAYVSGRPVELDSRLQEGDVLSLMSPMAGGAEPGAGVSQPRG